MVGVMSNNKPIVEHPSKNVWGLTQQNNNANSTIVQFNTAQLSSSSNEIASTISICNCSNRESEIKEIGPVLGEFAPYSAIGIRKVRAVSWSILPSWNGSFDPIPELIADNAYWQYGVGAHASPVCPFIGSIVLHVLNKEGSQLDLRHLVLDYSPN